MLLLLSYSDLSNSRWPPLTIMDFQGKCIWTILHVDSIFYVHTKFSEDILISDRDKNEFEKTPPGGRILLPVPTLTCSFFVDLRMCHQAKFQRNQTTGGRVMVIQIIQDGQWSAILDIQGWHILTILHIVAPHFLCMHQMEFEKIAPWRRNSTSGCNFDALSPAGTFVCVILQNFSQVGRLVAELHRFYHFTFWGLFLGLLPPPSSVGVQDPRVTQCPVSPKSVHLKQHLDPFSLFCTVKPS